jgi:hypothetical protein
MAPDPKAGEGIEPVKKRSASPDRGQLRSEESTGLGSPGVEFQ